MTNYKNKKIHFIGIGGIGMSALARYYKHNESIVSGSDGGESDLLESLKKEDMQVFTGGHNEANVPDDVDMIVYTIAISSDNPELIKSHNIAAKKDLKVLTYPEALGELTKSKTTICVAGTHGKTTTTAMIYYALKECGVAASMIVGSLIKDENDNLTNFISGDSEYLIIESCEYKRSFLNYNPTHIIITNIDADHLDYYKDIDDIKKAFQEFVDKMKDDNKEKFLIIHNNVDIFNLKANIKKVLVDDIDINKIDLSVPGIHNRENAQLVIGLCDALGLPKETVRRGLKNFIGTWRRQEYKGELHDMQMYDDYAHHPSEIKATLQAFREKFPDKKIIAAFQPHLYSRTKLLFDDFANSFFNADQVVFLPIYAAREQVDSSISSDMLRQVVESKNIKCDLVDNINILKDYMDINADKNTVFITLGAGDIYKVYNL